MNLVLFESSELASPLPLDDARAVHILEVLRRRTGDTFDAGLVDGPRGKARLTAIGPASLSLEFAWDAVPPPPLPPLTLLIGLPRPQTARKILQEATSMGVGAMHFVVTGRGEPSYAQSTLWSEGEWRRHVLTGVAQAFCTRMPAVSHGRSLAAVIDEVPEAAIRLALDNYEAPASLPEALRLATAGRCEAGDTPVVLAIGSERGWTSAERDLLRAKGFTLVHLGSRVLRSETAVTASIALVRAACGWL